MITRLSPIPDTLIALTFILGLIGATLLVLLKPPNVPYREALRAGVGLIVKVMIGLIVAWIFTAFTAFK